MNSPRIGLVGLVTAVVIVAGMSFGVTCLPSDAYGQVNAANATDKAEGRRDLSQIIKSLEATDVAYAAGNAAEAQARFGGALAGWNRLSPLISAREAREQQLLFDALGNQLRTSVPVAQVKSTVTGMIDELHDDIEAELK